MTASDDAPAQDAGTGPTAAPDDIDRARLSSGVVWLVRGIAITSVGLPLSLLDSPVSQAAPYFGPVGAVAVLLGVIAIVRATPRSPWRGPLVVLAALDVPMRIANELGRLQRIDAAAAEDAVQDAGFTLDATTIIALLTLGVTVTGVICLAYHLRMVLPGVAGDRWRQVGFAWIATLLSVPLVLATRALELLLVLGGLGAIAASLLLLSLLATYRAAEDDTLDADFPARGAT